MAASAVCVMPRTTGFINKSTQKLANDPVFRMPSHSAGEGTRQRLLRNCDKFWIPLQRRLFLIRAATCTPHRCRRASGSRHWVCADARCSNGSRPRRQNLLGPVLKMFEGSRRCSEHLNSTEHQTPRNPKLHITVDATAHALRHSRNILK